MGLDGCRYIEGQESKGPAEARTKAKGREALGTRTAIYARVSTVGNGQSPEMQVRELREYCQRRGWQVADEYVEVGISGAKDRRPQLDRMMADAHKRRFDIVAVWRFDRFARSVSQLLRALDTFRVLGIEFVSLSESLDTATPAGRMVFTVLGAVAELERSLVAERVRAGLRNARAKGKRLGRPRVIVDAARIGRLRKQGLSWATICDETGLSRGTAQRAVRKLPKNPVVTASVSPYAVAAGEANQDRPKPGVFEPSRRHLQVRSVRMAPAISIPPARGTICTVPRTP
jgi:DNA invertase Pin-like site-specific DNA recombinase